MEQSVRGQLTGWSAKANNRPSTAFDERQLPGHPRMARSHCRTPGHRPSLRTVPAVNQVPVVNDETDRQVLFVPDRATRRTAGGREAPDSAAASQGLRRKALTPENYAMRA